MAKPRTELATVAAVAQLVAVVVSVAALFFARDVFIPLALGMLLSFLLSPVVNRLERWGIPNIGAVVATAILAFVLLGGIFTLLARELSTLAGELPQYKGELVEKARGFAGLTGGMSGSLDELADEVTEAIEEETEPVEAEEPSLLQSWTDKLLPKNGKSGEAPHDGTSAKSPLYVTPVEESLPLATWASTAGTVLGPLATAGLVSVIALFLLIHRIDLRDRMIAIVSHGDYVTTTEALDEAGERISRYLLAQTVINAGYGIVLATGLTLIGITMTGDFFSNAILWGVLASCLRFIPYLGPTAAAIFPSVFALAVFPGYGVFIAVVVLITIMELVCNNIVEPWLYGTSTGISAVAVILAAIFWGWLWGPVGLLLSTPLTVCLVVLGRYVPRFKVLTTLLGEGIELKPSMRFYQRLLAADEHHAQEMFRDLVSRQGIEHAGDEMIIPAIKRIRADYEAEYLNEAVSFQLIELAGQVISAIAQDETPPNSDEARKFTAEELRLPTIIGCTTHHASESLVLDLFRIHGVGKYQLHAMEDDNTPQQVAQQVKEVQPLAVIITVIPKGGFAQARYLCRELRRVGYSGVIVVACFGRFKNYDKLLVKFRKAGATCMTTSLAQSNARIQAVLPRKATVSDYATIEPILSVNANTS